MCNMIYQNTQFWQSKHGACGRSQPAAQTSQSLQSTRPTRAPVGDGDMHPGIRVHCQRLLHSQVSGKACKEEDAEGSVDVCNSMKIYCIVSDKKKKKRLSMLVS